jgi:flagellar biosynthesis protein FliR
MQQKELTLSQKMTARIAAVAARTFSKQRLAMTGRTIGPLLVALAVSPLAAHAQGTVDLSGVTTAMSTVEKSCLLGGALAVIIGIVFGVFQFMGRNIAMGFISIGGGLFAGIVIGFAPQWVASLTGQSVSMVIMHATKVMA